jgi:hypothetical protein
MTAQEIINALNALDGIELTFEQESQILSLNQSQLDEIAEQLQIETSPAKVIKWLLEKLNDWL